MTHFTLSTAPVSATEGNDLVIALTRGGAAAGDLTIRWEIVPMGLFPAEAGDFSGGLMGSEVVTVVSGTDDYSITIALADDGDEPPVQNFTVNLYVQAGAEASDTDESLGSVEASIIDTDVDTGISRLIAAAAGSQLFGAAMSDDLLLNAGAENDIYVITRFQIGDVTISDVLGTNVVKFDASVNITAASATQTVGRTGVAAFSGDLELTLDTGAMVTIENAASTGFGYQQGAVASVAFADFVGSAYLNLTDDDGDRTFGLSSSPYTITDLVGTDDVTPDANPVPRLIAAAAGGQVFGAAMSDILLLNAGAENDIYVITRFQTGNVTISDVLGTNVVKFDVGVNITAASATQTVGRTGVAAFSGDLELTLDTGAMVTIVNATSTGFGYQLNDAELLSFVDLVGSSNLNLTDDDGDNTFELPAPFAVAAAAATNTVAPVAVSGNIEVLESGTPRVSEIFTATAFYDFKSADFQFTDDDPGTVASSIFITGFTVDSNVPTDLGTPAPALHYEGVAIVPTAFSTTQQVGVAGAEVAVTGYAVAVADLGKLRLGFNNRYEPGDGVAPDGSADPSENFNGFVTLTYRIADSGGLEDPDNILVSAADAVATLTFNYVAIDDKPARIAIGDITNITSSTNIQIENLSAAPTDAVPLGAIVVTDPDDAADLYGSDRFVVFEGDAISTRFAVQDVTPTSGSARPTLVVLSASYAEVQTALMLSPDAAPGTTPPSIVLSLAVSDPSATTVGETASTTSFGFNVILQPGVVVTPVGTGQTAVTSGGALIMENTQADAELGTITATGIELINVYDTRDASSVSSFFGVTKSAESTFALRYIGGNTIGDIDFETTDSVLDNRTIFFEFRTSETTPLAASLWREFVVGIIDVDEAATGISGVADVAITTPAPGITVTQDTTDATNTVYSLAIDEGTYGTVASGETSAIDILIARFVLADDALTGDNALVLDDSRFSVRPSASNDGKTFDIYINGGSDFQRMADATTLLESDTTVTLNVAVAQTGVNSTVNESQDIEITIANVDESPILQRGISVSANVSGNVDTAIMIDLNILFVDPDGDTLSYSIVAVDGDSTSLVALNLTTPTIASGILTFTPPPATLPSSAENIYQFQVFAESRAGNDASETAKTSTQFVTYTVNLSEAGTPNLSTLSAPLVVPETAMSELTGGVITATDSDSDIISFTIFNTDDPTGTNTTVIPGASATFESTYGIFGVTVGTDTDNAGGSEYSLTWTYTPNVAVISILDENVEDKITIRGADVRRDGTIDIVVTIDGQNALPTTSNTTAVGSEDTPLGLTAAHFPFADDEDDVAGTNIIIDSITAGAGTIQSRADSTTEVYTDVSPSDSGFITIPYGALSNHRFSPAANFTGDAVITFRVADDQGGSSASSTLTINLVASADRPEGANITISDPIVVQGSNAAGIMLDSASFAAAFTDVDGDGFAGIQIETIGANNTLLLSGSAIADGAVVDTSDISNLVFKPADVGASGSTSASFSFRFRDDSGVGGDEDLSQATYNFEVTTRAAPFSIANVETTSVTGGTSGDDTITGVTTSVPAGFSSYLIQAGDGNDTVNLASVPETVIVRFDSARGIFLSGGDIINDFEIGVDRLVLVDEAAARVEGDALLGSSLVVLVEANRLTLEGQSPVSDGARPAVIINIADNPARTAFNELVDGDGTGDVDGLASGKLTLFAAIDTLLGGESGTGADLFGFDVFATAETGSLDII